MDRAQAGGDFNQFLQMLFQALMERQSQGGGAPLYEDTVTVGMPPVGATSGEQALGAPSNLDEDWGGNVTTWPNFDPFAGGSLGDAGAGTSGRFSPSQIGYTRPDLLGKEMNPRGPQPGLGMGMGNIMAQLQRLGGGGNLPAYSQPPGWASGGTNPGRGMGQIAPQLGQMGSGGNQLGLLGQLARQVIGNVGAGAGAARGNAIRNIF